MFPFICYLISAILFGISVVIGPPQQPYWWKITGAGLLFLAMGHAISVWPGR